MTKTWSGCLHRTLLELEFKQRKQKVAFILRRKSYFSLVTVTVSKVCLNTWNISVCLFNQTLFPTIGLF